MTALPEDIARAVRDAAVVQVEDAAIKGRYPNARDGRTAIAEGFFDNEADATACLNQRKALIGTERRRFAVRLEESTLIDPTSAIPCWQLRDTEQAIDAAVLTARIEVDLNAETTTLELYG